MRNYDEYRNDVFVLLLCDTHGWNCCHVWLQANSERTLEVSRDWGATWNEVQLPSITPDQVVSLTVHRVTVLWSIYCDVLRQLCAFC